jgi:serine/threonine protein kinase
MAPEIVCNSMAFDGAKADVFSLGVLLFIMAFGNPPFAKAHS